MHLHIPRLIHALACATSLLLASPSFADTTIDLTGNVNSSVAYFGVAPSTSTFGQVITVPAGETGLHSFSFLMAQPSTIAFRGSVYAWDATNARTTGPRLFEGPILSTQGNGASNELITFDIPNGIPVTAGQQYVIFASTVQDQAGHSGDGGWGAIVLAPYPDGYFVRQDSNTTADWATTAWDLTYSASFDLAFRAVFAAPIAAPPPPPAPLAPTAIPTLSEWGLALMALLICGIAACTVRCQRHSA